VLRDEAQLDTKHEVVELLQRPPICYCDEPGVGGEVTASRVVVDVQAGMRIVNRCAHEEQECPNTYLYYEALSCV